MTFACAHPVPDPFHFLAGRRRRPAVEGGPERVRSGRRARLPGSRAARRASWTAPAVQARTVLNIDHHGDNRRYGDVNWVDTRAAATGEMVYDLIEAAGPAADRRRRGEPLHGDRHRHGAPSATRTPPRRPSAWPRGWWRSASIPPTWPRRSTRRASSRGLRLLGQVLQGIETDADGRSPGSSSTGRWRASPDLPEAEEFVNYPRSVRTAKVAVLFRELPDAVKVSLRAKGEVDVARIAAPPRRRRSSERGGLDPAGQPRRGEGRRSWARSGRRSPPAGDARSTASRTSSPMTLGRPPARRQGAGRHVVPGRRAPASRAARRRRSATEARSTRWPPGSCPSCWARRRS